MRLPNESYSIDVGTFVMNYHHGLLRFGIVEGKEKDEQGKWTLFDVHFFEDHIHERLVEWDKKMNASKKRTNKIPGYWLRPVSTKWLRNVLLAHGEYQDERRPEDY